MTKKFLVKQSSRHVEVNLKYKDIGKSVDMKKNYSAMIDFTILGTERPIQ